MKQILLYGTVFARMLPEQKQQMIELHAATGSSVGMCGDGTNGFFLTEITHYFKNGLHLVVL